MPGTEDGSAAPAPGGDQAVRLETLSVAALLRRVRSDRRNRADVAHLEDVSGAGGYSRTPPFRLDTVCLDGDQESLLATSLGSLVQTYQAVSHIVIRDALVVGQGAVVTCRNELVHDSVAEFIGGGLVPDGFARDGGGLTLGRRADRHVSRPTLLLKRPWCRNFGHWLVDGAALCALAAKLTLPPGWQVAVARQDSPAMRDVVHGTLSRLLPGIDVVEHDDAEAWAVSSLHYVTPVHVPPLFKLPEAIGCLRALMLRDRAAPTARRKRVYVARGPGSSRALANEADVIGLCRELGFEVVNPERTGILDQALLFHQSSLVLGVKGAALTNILFCSSRTHVVALSPGDFPDPFYWDLATQSGLRYSELFGAVTGRDQPRGHNPFTVSVPKLRAMLLSCMQDLERHPGA